MKTGQRYWGIACLLLMALLTGCGSAGETTASPNTAEPSSVQTEVELPAAEITPAPPSESSVQITEEPNDVLVVYFSRVGNTDFPDDIDAESSATLSRKDGELKGNAELIAEWIADETGGDLFEVETENRYPVDYRETTDVAKQEQNENARPTLKSHIENFDDYPTVYLVFPNWWGDLPMPLYTFFAEYDFSGKTVYVFVTHEGSGFSRTVSTIQNLEPDANVMEGISIRGSAVPDSETSVRQFVQDNSNQ